MLGTHDHSIACHTYFDMGHPVEGHLRRSLKLTFVADRLAVELSLHACFNQPGLEPPSLRLQGERSV